MRDDIFVILITLIGVLFLVVSGITEELGLSFVSVTLAVTAMVWFSIGIIKFRNFLHSELNHPLEDVSMRD
jgi:hypothetical protein